MMVRKLKYIVVITIIMIILLTVYQVRKKTWPPDDPSQMPGIVFMFIQWVSPDYDRGNIGFYDRNGQYYISEDQEVCSMRLEELIRAYEAGELEGRIIRSSTICDADELFENYHKLCEVSKNEALEIVYPLEVPAVVSDITDWYGIYYDEKGELQMLVIHRKEYDLYFDTNDKQANEIYEWYEGTFQK